MNEERTTDTIQGIRHRTTKSHPNCPVCNRLSVATHSANHIANNKEAIAEIDQTIKRLKAIKNGITVYHGSIIEEWNEIEALINTPLRRNNGRN